VMPCGPDADLRYDDAGQYAWLVCSRMLASKSLASGEGGLQRRSHRLGHCIASRTGLTDRYRSGRPPSTPSDGDRLLNFYPSLLVVAWAYVLERG
jgi:hypothetical protein